MRVLLSTGQGRLHLVDSAAAMHAAGIDIRLITGWVPRRVPLGLLEAAGKTVFGRKNVGYGLRKRQPAGFPPSLIYTCGASEFYQQALFLAANRGVMARSDAAVKGWRSFGRATRRFLRDADVFHVRSGAGRGGAIETAKARGMLTVADHSIAHPAALEKYLGPSYERAGQPLAMRPSDPFWKTVLQDCEEADYVLVNSGFVKGTFVEAGFDPERIWIAYQGVRADFAGVKQDYSRQGQMRLLFTGGFGLRKGADVLFDALRLLEKQGVDCRLDVVGTVADVDPPPDLIGSKRLVLHGHVPQDELKAFLRDADAYVFPSRAEGAASSAMEALTAGLPVIATLNSGVPIQHEVNALVVPVDSAEAVAESVARLAEDEGLRARLGAAAAREMKSGYTWEAYAERLKGLYQDALDKRSGARV